jgi:hypothetical protein
MPSRTKQPESEEEQREQEEQAAKDAEEKESDQREAVAPQAGGTPGGASESQQIGRKQSGPESLPGSQEAELPEYDPETARGVNVIPVGEQNNPGLRYDDDAAGKESDPQDEPPDDEPQK